MNLRAKLLRTVGAAFPPVREWENAVLTGEETADKLLADLRSRGWQITSEWDKGTLEIEVTLQQREVPQWERALFDVANGAAVPFHAKLSFVQPAAAARVSEARLPFQIRGVVGGDMPYVLLPDGEKLAQGGTWQGWRLATISANQIVFDSGARRAVIQR